MLLLTFLRQTGLAWAQTFLLIPSFFSHGQQYQTGSSLSTCPSKQEEGGGLPLHFSGRAWLTDRQLAAVQQRPPKFPFSYHYVPEQAVNIPHLHVTAAYAFLPSQFVH